MLRIFYNEFEFLLVKLSFINMAVCYVGHNAVKRHGVYVCGEKRRTQMQESVAGFING